MQRSYVMKERAKAREETRQRIVAAAAELHEEVGPKATTISAIAIRAGVQRLTVYRHFPDEAELFSACTAHWLGENPPPDPTTWAAHVGIRRCRQALSSLYRYYRKTERMWDASHRDEAEVPTLRAPMARFRSYLAEVADDLAASLAPPRKARKAVRATLAHAVHFTTWQSLAAEGLGDEAIAELDCDWVVGLCDR
jgi:AcrR family transcriptional regulator